MMPLAARWFMAVGAAYGLLAVGLGAFGAHALRGRLSADMLAVWRTAVEYQMYHALALLVVGWLVRQELVSAVSGYCFVAGVLLFSGSLYALSLSGIRILGAITPLGGVLLIAGWVALLISVLRAP